MADVDLADLKTFFSQIRMTLRSVNISESVSGKISWAPERTTWYEDGNEREYQSDSPRAIFMKSLEELEKFEASLTQTDFPSNHEAAGLNLLTICLDQALRMHWNAGRSLMQTLADASRERQCQSRVYPNHYER